MSDTLKNAPSVRPTKIVIHLSKGDPIELPCTDWKASRASGKPNANAITKTVLAGRMAQVGFNITILD